MTKTLTAESLAALRPTALMERAPLAFAVNMAAMVVEKRNTIPILSNLLLQGDGEGLTVTGTDLDVEIRTRVTGTADSRLAVTVPAHMLKDILAKAKASDLASIDDLSEGTAAIDMGGVRFKLQALPAGDFPDLSHGEFSHRFAVPADDLASMFDKVKFAISTEETRYYLNGIYLNHDHQGDLRAAATDGHRLAMMTLDAPAGSEGMPGVIVPRKAVKLLLDVLKATGKALGKGEALPPVTMEISASKIRFTVGAVTMTCKLIDGTYPDYTRCVPRHNEKRCTMDVKAMADAVNQVSLISSEKAGKVKLEFSNGACRFSVNNPDAGSAETTVAADYADGEMDIGFNARYVLDVLAEISTDAVTLHLAEAGSPTLFTDCGDTRFAAVLMPMRV